MGRGAFGPDAFEKFSNFVCEWTTYDFNPSTLEELFTTSCKGEGFITKMPIDEMNYCHLCGQKVKRSTNDEKNDSTTRKRRRADEGSEG